MKRIGLMSLIVALFALLSLPQAFAAPAKVTTPTARCHPRIVPDRDSTQEPGDS